MMFSKFPPCAALVLAGILPGPSLATAQDALRAMITVRNAQPQSCALSGISESMLFVAGGPGGGGQVGIPLSTLESVVLQPTPAITAARQAAATGDYSKAATTMGPVAGQLYQYINLPEENASGLLFKHGDFLRAAGRQSDAATVYKTILDRARIPSLLDQATAAYACALTSLGKFPEAEAALKNSDPLLRSDPLFPLDKIARGKIALNQKKYRASLDQFGQLTAYYRFTEPWYPEVLFAMADSYSGLSEETKKESTEDFVAYANAAQAIYADLYSFFPGSPETKLAEKKLLKKPEPRKKKSGPDPDAPATAAPETKPQEGEAMPFSENPDDNNQNKPAQPKDEMN